MNTMSRFFGALARRVSIAIHHTVDAVEVVIRIATRR
jgi:hypothetical protein